MHVTIAYESMFGCTRTVAEQVADGMRDHSPDLDVTLLDVTLLDAAQADAAQADVAGPGGGADLLVVAGPTHAFGMSRPGTRESAVAQGAAAAPARGLREWVDALPPAAPGALAACVTTRVSKPRVPGSAARGAARVLRRLGYRMVQSPATFWVEATPGPLRPDEATRARRWGHDLAASLAGRATPV